MESRLRKLLARTTLESRFFHTPLIPTASPPTPALFPARAPARENPAMTLFIVPILPVAVVGVAEEEEEEEEEAAKLGRMDAFFINVSARDIPPPPATAVLPAAAVNI